MEGDATRDSVSGCLGELTMTIDNGGALRQCYPEPGVRARSKTLQRLDAHCRNFIRLSPFLCLGTAGEAGADVAPRGDQPGFVRVLDEEGTKIAIPDWPGNNRLDSMENILENPQVGILFLIPGVDETLRVNGVAEISVEPELLSLWEADGKRPKSTLVVTVREAFLHCGKALIRSRLWRDDYKVDRKAIPSLGQMLKDQIQLPAPIEEIDMAIDQAYRENLY